MQVKVLQNISPHFGDLRARFDFLSAALRAAGALLTHTTKRRRASADQLSCVPHYFIHQASGAGLTSPPISAFQPAQIRHAYGFDLVSNQGAGQTIALVDAYDDPNAESDLAVFSQQFKLPVASTSNGFFRKVYASGHKPAANANWSVEISLDVEWAHAIAPKATIILVEAASNNLSDLLKGVDVAVRNGATVVSMSWDSGEFSGEAQLGQSFRHKRSDILGGVR